MKPSLDVLADTKSRATVSQGRDAVEIAAGAPACIFLGVLRFLHARHAATHRATSLYMPCHQ